MQATQDTVDSWSEPHPPKAESIKSFKELEHTIKKELVHLRHDHDSTCTSKPSVDSTNSLHLTNSFRVEHEKEYFQAVVSSFSSLLTRNHQSSL